MKKVDTRKRLEDFLGGSQSTQRRGVRSHNIAAAGGQEQEKGEIKGIGFILCFFLGSAWRRYICAMERVSLAENLL